MKVKSQSGGQSSGPSEHHPKSQGMWTILEEPTTLCCRLEWNKSPASGIALLLTVKRPPMHSNSCLRLQVHGLGWVPGLCQHCFLTHLGLTITL